MKKLSLDEIKSLEVELLEKISNICEKNGFRYSICAGTLLGAVRHKGFIPWDDDIDIMMPRSDYNAFKKFCKENAVGFKIADYTNSNVKQLFSKAYNPDTVLKMLDYKSEFDIGVFVDVFPLDGLGNSHNEAVSNWKKTRFLREILVARNWNRFTRSKTHGLALEPIRFLVFVISRFFDAKNLILKIESKYSKFNFDECKFASALEDSYRMRGIMSTEVYGNYKKYSFEGIDFNGFSDYDSYLRKIYGDYMKLPPKEKQVTHHSFDAYLK